MDLAKRYKLSDALVSKVKANLTAFDTPRTPPLTAPGRPSKLTGEILAGIADLLDDYMTVQLDGVVDFVPDGFGVEIGRQLPTMPSRG